MKRALILLGVAMLCATAVLADNDNDNDDLDDKAKVQAIAQLAAGANATQAQQIVNQAAKFDDDDDNWSGSWGNNGDIFDDDWQSIAALAASGKLNATVGNVTGSVLSFINSTHPTAANFQALYTNLSSVIQKQVQAAKANGQNIKINTDDLDNVLDDSLLDIVLGYEGVRQGIELLAKGGAITDPKLNATITKELAYLRQQLGSLVAVAGPLLNGTRSKVASIFDKEFQTLNKTVAALLANSSTTPQDLQRAAVAIISGGIRDFRNASRAILRDCDTLESLIGLYATGKSNSSILQELVNVGVGAGALQSSLQGVVKNLTSSLTAQSASGSVPADCLAQADDLDDISPSNPKFSAFFQKCGPYLSQIVSTNDKDWDKDWAQAANGLLANPTTGGNWALNCNLPGWNDDWDNDRWDD